MFLLRAFDWALFSHVCCPFLDWRCNSGVDEYSKIGLPTLYFQCETVALEFQFFELVKNTAAAAAAAAEVLFSVALLISKEHR